jgi:excisionase family DNA binding protein
MESEHSFSLTAQEAAQRLGVTVKTIYLYIRQGKLTARRIPLGLTWRLAIRISEIEALERKMQEAINAQ